MMSFNDVIFTIDTIIFKDGTPRYYDSVTSTSYEDHEIKRKVPESKYKVGDVVVMSWAYSRIIATVEEVDGDNPTVSYRVKFNADDQSFRWVYEDDIAYHSRSHMRRHLSPPKDDESQSQLKFKVGDKVIFNDEECGVETIDNDDEEFPYQIRNFVHGYSLWVAQDALTESFEKNETLEALKELAIKAIQNDDLELAKSLIPLIEERNGAL